MQNLMKEHKGIASIVGETIHFTSSNPSALCVLKQNVKALLPLGLCTEETLDFPTSWIHKLLEIKIIKHDVVVVKLLFRSIDVVHVVLMSCSLSKYNYNNS